MDFVFNDEHVRFRSEVSMFLRNQLGDLFWNNEDVGRSWDWQRSVRFCKALSASGWVGISWPKEYGGGDRDYLHQLILLEELAFWEAPRGPIYIAWDRVAWTLLLHGSEEQKQKYLPQIVDVANVWCQAFSEPGAGSDLASLSTFAEADGDDFIVNGEKIFISHAPHATHALLAVRTDRGAPKHKGISMLVMETDRPGITITKWDELSGEGGGDNIDHEFASVALDNVRIPRTNLIGHLNQGWYDMTTTLDAERAGVALMRLGYCRRGFELVRRYSADLSARSALRAELRPAIADLAIKVEVLRWLAYRVAWQQQNGSVPNAESSIARIFAGDLQQQAHGLAMRLAPAYSQLMPESKHAVFGGGVASRYLHSISATIAGGSGEIQRNVVASRGVGLPRA